MMLPVETPSRALAVYAHPDDPEVAVGGTLARWAAAGAEVWIVVTTRGDKGSADPDVEVQDLVRRRRQESEAAAAVLGAAGHVILDHADGDLAVDDSVLRRELVRLVREKKPDVVCCPDPTAVFFGDSYVNHRDHRATGFAAVDAVAPAAGNPHYFPELAAEGLGPHVVTSLLLTGTLEPNAYVDIAGTLDRKIDALYKHRSQLADHGEGFRDFMRERAEEAGRAVGVRHAELFRRIQL